MAASTEELKQMIRKLLDAAKTITPQLSAIAGKNEFELHIVNDEEGLSMNCSLGWDPAKDAPEFEVSELPEGVEVEAYHKARVVEALDKAEWNKDKVCEMLGVSLRSLNKWIKKYKLKIGEPEQSMDERVVTFMQRWHLFATCPVPLMHGADQEHYIKRIRTYEQLKNKIEKGGCKDLSELHIAQQKQRAIIKDFEDLYRKTNHLPIHEDVEPVKTIMA